MGTGQDKGIRQYADAPAERVSLKAKLEVMKAKVAGGDTEKAYATKGKGKRRNLIRKSEIFLFLFPTLFPTCYNYFGWE